MAEKTITPAVNRTMDLAECRGSWTLNETYGCWCLEDVQYVPDPQVPACQRLSVFVPRALMGAGGEPLPESRKVPVIFENNAAGYVQMPNTKLGGPRCYAEPYLRHGLIYVTCGCRGRNSRNAAGEAAGKAPETLVDLKAAIRFLRHNAENLPGDYERIFSVGWSAGGAMSALLSVTGDSPRYDPWLRKAGAFMDESDAVYAAQIYCPIIDLEHADMAYEWCFGADRTCEDSPAGPGETMTPFKEALSRELSARYADYINGLGLRHPVTGEPLTLGSDGRSGSFYACMLERLSASAADFLQRLEDGRLTPGYSAEAYLKGDYTYEAPVRERPAFPADRPPTDAELEELMSRPPRIATFRGTDKRAWLAWDGSRAAITDLDAYVLRHRRRMKPCTSFDKLPGDSGENQEFGSATRDCMHFSPSVLAALETLRRDYPAEAERYAQAFAADLGDPDLAERVYLLNPMNFIATDEACSPARHYRIRVGASDADTSFSVSMVLALRLANAGYPVDYALVWDQPHSEADYPGEVLQWIDSCLAGDNGKRSD